VDYKVRLVTTKPNYGGRRWWFICPLVRRPPRRSEALSAVPDGTCFERVGVLGPYPSAIASAMRPAADHGRP
jgi:hypothetical protein